MKKLALLLTLATITVNQCRLAGPQALQLPKEGQQLATLPLFGFQNSFDLFENRHQITPFTEI
jgi:hypothetical protein